MGTNQNVRASLGIEGKYSSHLGQYAASTGKSLLPFRTGMSPPPSYISLENIQQGVTSQKTWFYKLKCAITTIKTFFPNLLNNWTERAIKCTMEINYFNIYSRYLPGLCYCLATISHLVIVLILYGAVYWTILTLWPPISSTSTNILRRGNDWT
jgi:hypothetical protein